MGTRISGRDPARQILREAGILWPPFAGINQIRFMRSAAVTPPSQPGFPELPRGHELRWYCTAVARQTQTIPPGCPPPPPPLLGGPPPRIVFFSFFPLVNRR